MKLRQQIAITTVLAAVVGGGWAWLAGTEDGAESRTNEGKRGAGTRVFVEPIALVRDRALLGGYADALRLAAARSRAQPLRHKWSLPAAAGGGGGEPGELYVTEHHRIFNSYGEVLRGYPESQGF
mgnify:CR=1 FL=1